MTRNRCSGWAQRDQVTFLKADGSVRAVGRVVIFKDRNEKWRLKIHLTTAGSGLGQYGEWVWPEGWIWGQGTIRSRCVVGCGQEYLTNLQSEADAEFCPPCERREQKERSAAGSTVRDHVAYAFGSKEFRPKAPPMTPERKADIAAVKERDEKEQPF